MLLAMTEERPIDRLVRWASELGWNLTQLGAALELNNPSATITNWKKRGMPPEQYAKAAEVTGRSVDELLGLAKDSDKTRAVSSPSMQPILAWEHEDDLPPGEFVMIPRLGVKLSAGNGNEQVEIEFVEKQPQAFRADWIRQKRFKPAKLASMTASGESMEPRIFDGDALVVDTAQQHVVDGKVYAIWYDGGERVKRLYRLPGGGLRIRSDNPSYESIELTAEQQDLIRVIGRVVHIAGDGGL